MLLKCRGVHMYRDEYNIFTIFSQIDRVKYFWPDAVFCKFWHCLTSQCVELGNLQQLVTAVDELKDPDCANACNR